MKLKIPIQAKKNVYKAIIYNQILDNKCATIVGKHRSNQILEDKPMSKKTLQRTYAYLSRAKVYATGDWSRCGTISYNLWGGDAMHDYLKKLFNK